MRNHKVRSSEESKFYIENTQVEIKPDAFEAGETDSHEQEIERFSLKSINYVIWSSFISLALVSFIPFNSSAGGEKAKEKLASFASGAGTTALGALVAVLARKRRSD